MYLWFCLTLSDFPPWMMRQFTPLPEKHGNAHSPTFTHNLSHSVCNRFFFPPPFFFCLFRATGVAYGQGIKSELWPPADTTAIATAMLDSSQVCNLHRSSWQHQILNPLNLHPHGYYSGSLPLSHNGNSPFSFIFANIFLHVPRVEKKKSLSSF